MKRTLNFDAREIRLEVGNLSYGVNGFKVVHSCKTIEEARARALEWYGIECRFGRRFDRLDCSMQYYGEKGDEYALIYGF